jgi:hypothetical protein
VSTTLLAPGVLVGTSGPTPLAWVAGARGVVTAIQLDDGGVRWQGPAEGLPLALIDSDPE